MSQPLPIVMHQVIPENLKTEGYNEFDQIDFLLTFEGRAIDLGSVRLEGEMEVKYGAEFLNSTNVVDGSQINLKDIKIDPLAGAHSVCESWTTAIGGGSGAILENLTEYPRYVKMSTAATSGADDMNNASHVVEMKAPLEAATTTLLQGIVPQTQPTNPLRLNPDFSIKPMIALNAGKGAIPYERTGAIRLTLTLARNQAVFFGLDSNANVTYVLRDLRLRFKSVPEGDKEPVMMRTKVQLKQSIQSSFANVQSKVPAECLAVSASFQPQIEENTGQNNNLQLSKVPNLTKTNFIFNDATNTLVSYEIKNNSEITGRFIDSFMDTGRNSLSTQKLANNNGFGVGLAFGQVVPLQNQKFSIQLTSDISSAVPYLIYMYFHSFVSV